MAVVDCIRLWWSTHVVVYNGYGRLYLAVVEYIYLWCYAHVCSVAYMSVVEYTCGSIYMAVVDYICLLWNIHVVVYTWLWLCTCLWQRLCVYGGEYKSVVEYTCSGVYQALSDMGKDSRRTHSLLNRDSKPEYKVTNSFYSLSKMTSSILVLETEEKENKLTSTYSKYLSLRNDYCYNRIF